jgi:hypothetical protein
VTDSVDRLDPCLQHAARLSVAAFLSGLDAEQDSQRPGADRIRGRAQGSVDRTGNVNISVELH